MTAPRGSRVALHLMRVAAAITISIVVMLGVMALLRFVAASRWLTWYGAPIAIAAGYVPLWRWYPRDAYPIGLVFCPAMFFVLSQLAEWVYGAWGGL